MSIWDWPIKKLIVFWMPEILVVLAALVWLLLRKTIWTRFRKAKDLAADQDIHEFMIVFDWSRKVLYVPTILASLAACAYAYCVHDPESNETVAAIWLAVFFVNFLIDEFRITLKVLLMTAVLAMLLFLWLAFMDWVTDFLNFFAHLGIEINWVGYLVMAIIFSTAVVISWLNGLFSYVAITPNFMEIHEGPTESSEQVSREEFHTRIDTADFLERVMGFGRIVITFRDTHRPPMLLLVGRIRRRTELLESIRANLAVESHKSPMSSEGDSSA